MDTSWIGSVWLNFVRCCVTQAAAQPPLSQDAQRTLSELLGVATIQSEPTDALHRFFKIPDHRTALRTLNHQLFSDPIPFRTQPVRLDAVIALFAASGPERFGRIWTEVLNLGSVCGVEWSIQAPARDFLRTIMAGSTPLPPDSTVFDDIQPHQGRAGDGDAGRECIGANDRGRNERRVEL